MRLWLIVIPAFVLAGCEALEEKDAALCRADGFVAGTLAFEACLQNRHEQRRLALAMNAADQAQSSSSAASLTMVHR